MYCEDKLIKMENKPVKPKRMKPPNALSLLTPLADKEIASSYSAFQQVKKKHMQRKRGTSETKPLSPEREVEKHRGKYTRLRSESGSDDPIVSETTNGNGNHKSQTVRHSMEIKVDRPSQS